jgi:hypothetical protein
VVKVGVFVWKIGLKPVFGDKFGVFVELGSKQKWQDDDGIFQGFPLNIL